MNKEALEEWLKLTDQNRQNIFGTIAKKIKLLPAAIEKDWWVTRTLELVFQTEIAPHTIFKGGTSLSKAWNIIERFSEDIDLALDRKFLGFAEEMTITQVKKLRKRSVEYLSQVFYPVLQKAFGSAGFEDAEVKLQEVAATDSDPVIIEVKYRSITESTAYLQPRVLIEIGSRSLIEPFTVRTFSSFVGEHFKGRSFADIPISIPVVNPERTFLEKIFLLHEAFQQPPEKIRTERKSRHLYDLEKMMDEDFAVKVLANKAFYQHIVEYRRILVPVRGINYDNHSPDKINPLPPDVMMNDRRKDYEQMRESMIYTPSLSFDELIKRITELKSRINALNYG